MKAKQKSIFMTLAVLFAVVSLFQNCGGSDFNVSEYTNQASLGLPPAPVVPPVVISKSSDLAIAAGQPALFSVSTSGSAPVTYTWFKDNQPIAGAVESSYFIPATVTTDAGTYAVVATNSAGSVSTTFLLTVMATPPPPPPANTAPVITTAPAAYVYLLAGDTLRLQVVATGAANTYQWYFTAINSTTMTAIAGATSTVYVKTNARPVNSGTYTVVVTNAGGTVSAASDVEIDPDRNLNDFR